MMFHDAFRKPVGDKTGARPLTFIAFFLALLVACLWGAKAHAHRAPSGVFYLPECCNSFDCSNVSDSAVEDLGGGYVRMTIKPGTHPMWGIDRQHDLVIDFGPQHRRAPLDGDWHGCFGPSQNALCYHPPMRSF